jgi:hypothetical protein
MLSVTTVTTVTTYTIPRQAVTVVFIMAVHRPCCERSKPTMRLLAGAIRGYGERKVPRLNL